MDFFSLIFIFLFAATVSSSTEEENIISCNPVPGSPPNSPIGDGRGIFPGRVVWLHNPEATTWNGESSNYWDSNNLDEEAIKKMFDRSISMLTGEESLPEAWDALFKHFNKEKHEIVKGYSAGEKIAIKCNLNGDIYYFDDNNGNEVTPSFIRSLIRHLVTEANVPEDDITLYDGSRWFTNKFASIADEFPGVHWQCNPGRPDATGLGPFPDQLESVEVDWNTMFLVSNKTAIPYYNITKLPTVATEASYMIELNNFRGHVLAGMTMSGKNFFGSIYRSDTDCSTTINGTVMQIGAWCPMAFHKSVTVTEKPMGSYNVLVDLLGHPKLGGNVMLFLSDAMYGGPLQNVHKDTPQGTYPSPPIKFASHPFNNHWSSSVFASQDPIALDSVAFDIIRSEPNIPWARLGCVDNYLHEGAMANNPTSKTVYNPSGTEVLKSLGVHEHWNNGNERRYEAIDLLYFKYDKNSNEDSNPHHIALIVSISVIGVAFIVLIGFFVMRSIKRDQENSDEITSTNYTQIS